MSVPCPKCGADSDDIGSKYVCGDCYWVFDKGGGLGTKPRAVIDVPTPQRPTLSNNPPKAPVPAAQPAAQPPASAPLASAPSPAASAAPTACPKCSGNLVNIAGKFVCEKCFHTVDTPDAPADQKAAPGAPSSPQAPRSASPNPQPLPGSSSNPNAPLTTPAATTPAASGASGVCPKCSGQLMDIGGKLVCGDCYHVVDSPGAAPTPAKGPLSIMPSAAAPIAPVIPTVCPKCSGKLMDVGGKYVCDECYHVVDSPSTPSKAKSSFTPQPTEPTEEGAMTPQMIGGIALILLLLLMIVVLAIRH